MKSTCGINLHQYAIGNIGGKDTTVDFMHYLYFGSIVPLGLIGACLDVCILGLFVGLQ